MSTIDPAEALDEARKANAAMIARAKAPVWYHPVLGALAGGFAFVDGAPAAVSASYFVAFFVGLLALMQVYRHHTGAWVSGLRKGRTRWVAAAAGVLSVCAMLVGVVGRLAFHRVWPSVLAGLFVFIVVTALGFVWEVVYRRELEAEARS